MSNKQLFASKKRPVLGYVPPTNTLNEAGGTAYSMSAHTALAQYASTGTFHGVFYSSAEEQLDSVIGLLDQIVEERGGELYIARVAVYARRQGFMKDMPALLTAYLGCKGRSIFERTFRVVIDNGRMLRTFVQMIRSGKLGRRSFGSRMKRAIRGWFNARNSRTLLNASVGNNPSLADVIKMVHPRPRDSSIDPKEQRQRELFYGYLLGRVKGDTEGLPGTVQAFEHFKKFGGPLPDVNFQLLTSEPLGIAGWMQLAHNAGHQWLRMNLNALHKHQVFERRTTFAEEIARKISDPLEVAKARQFPYQYQTALKHLHPEIPGEIRYALQTAMDYSVGNVPDFPGRTLVFIDMSNSMRSPVTGDQGTATTATHCLDVAALFAAIVAKRCMGRASLYWFATEAGEISINPHDSLVRIAGEILGSPSGGTAIFAPLHLVNANKVIADQVIYLSDNQSWADTSGSISSGRGFGQGTAAMDEWRTFKRRNPSAKLVCIDLQANASTQAPDQDDILNIGGWSDRIFPLIAAFLQPSRWGIRQHWVDMIEKVDFTLDATEDGA